MTGTMGGLQATTMDTKKYVSSQQVLSALYTQVSPEVRKELRRIIAQAKFEHFEDIEINEKVEKNILLVLSEDFYFQKIKETFSSELLAIFEKEKKIVEYKINKKIVGFYECKKQGVIDTISEIFSSTTSLLQGATIDKDKSSKLMDTLDTQLQQLSAYIQKYQDFGFSMISFADSLEKYIPHFKSFQTLCQAEGVSIIDTLKGHIATEQEKNLKAINNPEYKKAFTRQVVAGLLRAEVSHADSVNDMISATYVEGFAINDQIQQKLKKEKITLMDMTLEMLDLDEKDVKMLLYAMMVRKNTGKKQHPITSSLYTIDGNDIGTLKLTEIGIKYFQTAVQGGLEFHCQELYGKASHESGIPGLQKRIKFSDTDDIVKFYLGTTEQDGKRHYVEEHKSDILATARCLIHSARRSDKDVDDTIEDGTGDTIRDGAGDPFGAFEDKKAKAKEINEFLQGEWKNLPIADKDGQPVEPNRYTDNEQDIWHNEDLYIAGVNVRFVGRAKSFESKIRKQRNDPDSNHIKNINDDIANRFEIYPTGDDEQDRQNIVKVHQALFNHFTTKGNGQSPGIKIKGTLLKAAYQKAIDNGTIVKNTPFCKLVQKAINKENDNAKTSSLYEESKTYSSKENGDEYQILISETDKYGFNNHAIYDPKKRIADKIRISGSITKKFVGYICETELEKNISKFSGPYIMRIDPDKYNSIPQIEAALLLYINQTIREQVFTNGYPSIPEKYFGLTNKNNKITFEKMYDSLSGNTEEEIKAIEASNRKYLLATMNFEAVKDLSFNTEKQKYFSLKANKRLVEVLTDCHDIMYPGPSSGN